MSRPRKPPETPEQARLNFIREVKIRRVHYDMTQKELADEVGVVPSVMSNLLSNPYKISAGRLRTIVQTLEPNPATVLALVGYSEKQIKNWMEENKS